MKNKVYILFMIAVVTFGGCKRDKDEVPTVTPLLAIQDMAPYSIFKKGTYWIYKDSATNVEDSVYVYGDTSYAYYQNNNIQKAGYYMFYYCVAHSFYSNLDNSYSISMGNYSISDGYDLGVQRERTGSGIQSGTSLLMFNEFVVGKAGYYYGSPGTIYFEGQSDSIDISGLNIHNVVHFHDTKNASEIFYADTIGYVTPVTDFYIAKNVGIVRKRINDMQFNLIHKTYNLVRYHIIQ